MNDQVCAIVGAGPGISLAVAQRFAREGFRIALVARRAEALDGYAAALRQGGADAHGFPADAADVASLARAFAAIAAQVGAPDVLVYNAATGTPGAPSNLDVDRLVADFRVNVGGALLSAQQVIPSMRGRGRGTILFTGGGLALNPWPQAASLAVGKAGIRNLAYSLGAELEPEGIHVATVTIAGMVRPGTQLAPSAIAEVFWQLHRQSPGQWEREIICR